VKKNTVHVLLLLVACFALNSCGTKGALFIPEQKYPQATPAKN
jgi:predicted small lipoprotein YifL